jgi:sensor c-di-GMP phosphodiesterase-like protein
MQFILQDTTNVPPDTKQNLHEDDEFQGNACSNAVGEIQKAVGNFYKDNSDYLLVNLSHCSSRKEKSGCVKRNSNDNDNPMTNTIVITIRRTVSSSPIRSRLAALQIWFDVSIHNQCHHI